MAKNNRSARIDPPMCFILLILIAAGDLPTLKVRNEYFFFQAEADIRDLTVTGVQTCALPISPADEAPAALTADAIRGRVVDVVLLRARVDDEGGRAPSAGRPVRRQYDQLRA